MVKDTNSLYFDSAYFVLKSDLPKSAGNSDMLAEAHRMIEACGVGSSSKKKNARHTVAIIAIFCAAALIVGAGVLILLI